MDNNWSLRPPGNRMEEWGRSFRRSIYGNQMEMEDRGLTYYDDMYQNTERSGSGRRFVRNRSQGKSDRQDYYRSRAEPQPQSAMFRNPVSLPSDEVFQEPRGDPPPNYKGHSNPAFQPEGVGELYADFVEPDYGKASSDEETETKESHQEIQLRKPEKQTKTVENGITSATKDAEENHDRPNSSQKRARWDVFGETEDDSSTSQSDSHTWKVINAVMRLVVAIVFFIFILVSAITSRLSFLLIVYNVRPGYVNFTVTRHSRMHVLKDVQGHMDLKWLWALMIVITAPYLFTALTCLWRLIFKKSEKLRCGPLFAALLIETLHSLGLCTMVFYVLPSFDPVIGLFMLLNIAFFPGLIQVFQRENKTQEIVAPQTEQPANSIEDNSSPGSPEGPKPAPPKKKNEKCRRVVRKVLDVVMVMLHLGTMAVWSYHAYQTLDNLVLAVLTPLSMLLTSLNWWDNYVSGKKERPSTNPKTNASKETPNGDVPQANDEENTQVKTVNPNPKPSPKPKVKAKVNILTALKRAIKKRRTKITFITSLWKIILTISYPAVVFGYGSDAECLRSFFFFYEAPFRAPNIPLDCSLFTDHPLNYVDDLKTCHNYYPLLAAAVNVFCSILCYKIAKSACKVLLQIPCLVIPMILVTPITLVLLVASYMDPADFKTAVGCSDLPWVSLQNGVDIGQFLEDFTVVYWVPAGFAAFLSLLYITGHVWNPRVERMARTDKLFSKPMYCGVLLDQSLMLNRRRDEDDPTDHRLAGQWIEQTQDVGELTLDVARTALRKDTTPLIYICATMWHESETEMIMMLKSIFRLDADQSARKTAQLFFNITDPDYYEFEAHIFFDDAYNAHLLDEMEYMANDFVKQLVRVMDTAASAVHGIELQIPKPFKIPTPYGGRLVWKLPGGNTITAHLKDKVKIRHRKRWSQVMYMYYFLGYKLIDQERLPLQRKQVRADNTFLLALDGDVDFQPEAVQILVDRMKQTPELGAACGRIHPIGSGPMVWYQKFEYAVSHWLQKATEHILGCVLCSPGCFSLFRGSALMDDNVMKRYTTPPSEARHYVQYDQGEDRWLCTLLLQQGHRVEYCAASDSYTFAPEGFYEFYNQRRRWTPSTMANIIDLLGDWKNTTKNNQDISILYIVYQLSLLASGIITPGTIFLLIVGAISNATEDSIPLWAGLLLNGIPIVIFVVLCFKADSATQLAYAGVLSIFYTIVMMLVLVGIIKGAAENGFCSVSTTFLLGVVGVFVITALLHPMEFTNLLHGFLYFLSIPSMSMLLLIYSLANLDNVSWGTREVKSAAPPPPTQQAQQAAPKKTGNANFIKEALGKLADTHNAESDYAFSFGNLFRCLCCPREGNNPNDLKFQTIMKSIEVLDSKMTELTMTSGVGDSLRAVSDIPEDSPPESPTTPHKKFSEVPELFEGAVEKVNPLQEKSARDELKNPMWSEDVDLGEGPKEFIDDDEKTFWNKFIGQYLFPMDKDEKHEKAVKAELMELRNKVSLAFLLINGLFVVLISSLQIISENTTNLSIQIPCSRNASFTGEKIEPISVTFTLVFGIMLTLQFLAMLFHRYSTMLHIISITEIKFKKLTRQMFGMQKTEETQPTVEETINLVREMQAIRNELPEEPEADYDDDLATPMGTAARRRSGGELWGKLNARTGIKREQTLGRAFMKNFEKLAKQIRHENVTENNPVDMEDGMKHNFRNLQRKSLHTIVKIAKDSQYKDHILKRSREPKRLWQRGVGKILGGKFQFKNIVEEAKERKEEEEEQRQIEEEENQRRIEEAARATSASYSGQFLSPVDVERGSPSPATSIRSPNRRQRMPNVEEEDAFSSPDTLEYPSYQGARFDSYHKPSFRSSGHHSGLYDESGPPADLHY